MTGLPRSLAVAVLAVVAVSGLAGCRSAGTGGATSVAVGAGATPSGPAATSTSQATTTPTRGAAPSATATHAAAATRAPQRATSVGDVLLAGGVVLPNATRTPGATNPAVTQATILRTICLTGYTRTVRPPSSYTTGLKEQQLASGYAFRGDGNPSDYEEDHLISLELGGSPTSAQNLWPEPYAATEGARVKDRVENELHDLVCSGRLSLRAAQHAIATNWWAAYQRYGGAGAPHVYAGAYGVASPTRSSSTGTSTTSSGGPTAQCRDGSYSYSQHRSGTCSHHGGVDHWINPPPS